MFKTLPGIATKIISFNREKMSLVLPASSNLIPGLRESRGTCNMMFTVGDNGRNTNICMDQEEKIIPKQIGRSYSILGLNTVS